MANISAFVQDERHDNRACNARGHRYLRTLQLRFVDEQFFSDAWRNVNIHAVREYAGAWLRLCVHGGCKERCKNEKNDTCLHGKRLYAAAWLRSRGR